MELYIPHLIEGQSEYAEMCVRTEHCPICKKIMVGDYKLPGIGWEISLFPTIYTMDFDAQIRRAGWVRVSNVKVDDKYICQECVAASKADFLCALCGQRKLTNKEKESFGCYPTEFLCLDCYKTVSAKVWDEKVEELREVHRWDFD